MKPWLVDTSIGTSGMQAQSLGVEHPTKLQIFITAATHGLVMHTHSELCLHKGLGPCRPTQGSEQCAWGAGDPN